MAVSRPCDHCGKVKRCHMYTGERITESEAQLITMVYLCRPCARELGYREAA